MKKSRSVVAILLTCIIFSVSAKSFDEAWKLLDEAKMQYDYGEVGQALKYAENAKEMRKNASTEAVDSLESALKPLAVQEVGDGIPEVEEILTERMENDALKYIRILTDLYGNSWFNNSITEIKEFYRERTVYPEADYLIGKIYMMEGEYYAAADFFDKAIENAAVLDIPDVKYDILYDAAELARLQKKEEKYEGYLLRILEENTDFVAEKAKGSGEYVYTSYLTAIVNYARRETSLDQFFLLYRSSQYKSLNALLKLTDYYQQKGEQERARNTGILASIISFTRIYEIMTGRNRKYEYKTFDGFLKESEKYRDVREWMDTNCIWKGFYNLGIILNDIGNESLSEQMMNSLIQYCPDKSIVNSIRKSH